MKKLLSPSELKEFRLQQEEQRRIFAADMERKKLEQEKKNKKLVSPKELFDPKPISGIIEESVSESLEEPVEEKLKPKDPIEVLRERIEDISSKIKEPKYYDEELAHLKNLLSNKIELDEVDFGPINSKIDELYEFISKLPEIKYYDKDLDKLSKRIDQLQTLESRNFYQYEEYLKDIKEDIRQIFDDLVNINKIEIPESFDPTNINRDIESTKEKFYVEIENIKKELSELPEVRYYDDELLQLQEKIEFVRNSIPNVPEIKYYDNDLKNLLNLVNEVRNSIPELPEVRYYENEIFQLENSIKNLENRISKVPEVRYYENDIKSLQEKIKNVENKIPEIPEIPEIPKIPEVRYYDEEIEILLEDIDKVRNNLVEVKLAVYSVEKSVNEIKNKEIPEAFDSTELENEIEKAFIEIEKLKEKPNVVKEDTDPLLPLDQKFVTFEDLASHYRTFINRIQQQLATIGGGGETQLKYLDDIVGIATNASAYNNKFLKYNHSIGKFEFASVGAGSQNLDETLQLGNSSSLGMSVGVATVTSLNVDSVANFDTNTITFSSSSPTQIYSFSATQYRSARLQIQITQGTDYQTSDILLIHNGSVVNIIEYASISTNDYLGTFDALIIGGNVSLQVLMGSSSSSTIKVVSQAISL